MDRRWTRTRVLLAGTLLALSAGCREVESALGGATPHERYAESLERAGLAERALGREWMAAANAALESPIPVALPYRETGYLAAGEAAALGYRVDAERGRRLVVNVDLESEAPVALFVDLFAIDSTEVPPYEHLESADSGTTQLTVELDRDGAYLIRLQPELLRSVRYTVTIAAEPTLAFPVDGVDTEAVKSRFGVERDGGRRQHEGIDIFAPRGTPALAAVPGVVRGVGLNRLGGKVVWLWDAARGQALYYAHLDSQLVSEGAQVEIGDTVGLIGNTGNARTTPPHLHFGIYRRGFGALDPYPFIYSSDAEPPEPLADSVALDYPARIARGHAVLRGLPEPDADSLDSLAPASLVRVVAGSGDWYRVLLPDGRTGFLEAGELIAATEPLSTLRLDTAGVLLERPDPAALAVDSVQTGARLALLGRFADFAYVRDESGREGWVGARR